MNGRLRPPVASKLSDGTESKSVGPEPVDTPPPSATERVNVLLVSPHSSDEANLRKALAGTRWNVLHAPTCSDALATMQESVVPVIIRDHECCSLGCAHSVKCNWLTNCPAALLIAVDHRDFRLWEEVLDSGGLDTLPKPFEAATVRKYLEFAHKHWVMGALRRDWDHFDYPE